MRSQQTLSWAALGALWIAGAAGCGTPGAPQPPSLYLPEPVSDLSAIRAGDQVTLTWTMPKKNTDKLKIKEQVSVRVCRREKTGGACVDAGTLALDPGADGTWTDTLPPALAAGAARPLVYCVELKNKRGQSAGLSNPADLLAGAAPDPVEGFAAEVQKAGVVLHWNAAQQDTAIRLRRKLLTPQSTTKPKESLTAPPPETAEQDLLIEDTRQGRALDQTARFGEAYEYQAQRVVRVMQAGTTLEMDGAFSPPVRVDVQDVFPPAVPTGLVAVAMLGENGAETAVDLSWHPDPEADVAGYVVYRREGDRAWERISPGESVVGPAFHDTHVQPGHTYHYAVIAVDRGGHESARSQEAEETVPAQ